MSNDTYQKSCAAGRSVLISGASIGGPVLAYWLHRYGFAVTIIEKAGAVRGGGYPIDVRGNALEVTDRMGLTEFLERAHIDMRLLSFVDDKGTPMVSVRPERITGGRIGRDVELPRGVLTTLLYELTRHDVTYRFNSSIDSMTETESGVDVIFNDGSDGHFDVVVGADGLHSNTRKMVFGPENVFDRNIGFCFAGFSVPNTFGLNHEGVISNRPGKMVTLFAPATSEPVHILFNTAHAGLAPDQARNPAYQRKLITDAFSDWGWLVPELLRALAVADDLYFDEIKQIKMPQYATGRVALVGDAGYAPSFLTGTGTSLAIVGAYVLAGELALQSDHRAAFAAYEHVMRPFVAANHALLEDGLAAIIPPTQAAIDQRNLMLATISEPPMGPAMTRTSERSKLGEGRAEYCMVDLSGYLGITANA